MFGSGKPSENAYAKTDLETGVLSASPHKLTTMLRCWRCGWRSGT
jgi:hypothetical protein